MFGIITFDFTMDQSFRNSEKLKRKTQIEALFKDGNAITVFPLRLIYKKMAFEDQAKLKVGVSVSKRHFKNAVDRNRIKRLLREGYRLNKATYLNNIPASYAFMILYIGKTGTTFDDVNKASKTLFKKFLDKI